MITKTDPADGASGVEPMPVITVSFDEPVAVREPADGLQLLDESGQPVPGTVEVDGDEIRFVPADGLALLGAYTAVVTPAVTDVAGNPLAGEHRFKLSRPDGAWDSTGTPIENNDSSAMTPDVAMNPRGNVTVVWSQSGLPSSIWANHYDARTGLWETAQMIEYDDAGDALQPRVAMDAAGNAIAVWQQSDGTHTHVWASRRGATGWDAPVRLDTSDTADARGPRIAMNAGGAAIVVWRHVEGTITQAWINRFDVESGWGVAEPVQISGQPAAIVGDDDPVVGIDAEGNAIVLVLAHWFDLQAVPHLAASGWGEAEMLIHGPADIGGLAMAPSGHALALWHLPQASRIHAWSRHPEGEWRIDNLMEAESEFGQLRPGHVAVNPAGNGIALWIQDSPGPRQVWAGVYSAAAQAWSEPQGLYSTNLRPRSTQVAMDPRGNAHAIWIVSDGNDYQALITTRRVAPGGFGATTLHEGIENASLAANAQGKAVIIRAVQTCTGTGTRIDLDAVFFR